MYAEIFCAALQSAAFVESDLRILIEIGLSYIPEDSVVAAAIRTAVECYDSGVPVKEARRIIHNVAPGTFGIQHIRLSEIPKEDNEGLEIGAAGFDAPENVAYMIAAWLVVFLFPGPIMGIFSSDASLIEAGIPCMHIYYFGMFFMAFMMTGQSTFVGLGMSKHSIFFSLLRKVIVVVPLTILLPKIPALGVMGVFLAEPISNVIGAMGSYLTMLHVTGRVFRQKEAEKG